MSSSKRSLKKTREILDESLTLSFFDKVDFTVVALNLDETIAYLNPAAWKEFPKLKKATTVKKLSDINSEWSNQIIQPSDNIPLLGKTSQYQLSCTALLKGEELTGHLLRIENNLERYPSELAKFKQVFSDITLPLQIYNKEGLLVDANEEWGRLWNIDQTKAIGWYNIYRDRAIKKTGFDTLIRKAFNGESGSFHDIEFEASTLNGQNKWIRTKYFPLKNKDGSIDHVAIYHYDESSKILTQHNLAESEERFKALVENFQGVSYMITEDYELIYINKSIKKVTGYTPSVLLEKEVNFLDRIRKKDVSSNKAARDKSLKERKNIDLQYRFKRKDNKWIWLRDTGQAIYDQDGKIKYVVGYLEDITLLKKAKDELKSSENKFKSIFQNAGHGIMIADSFGQIVEVNKRAARMLGFGKTDLKKHFSIIDITHPDDRDETRKRIDKLRSGDVKRIITEKRFSKKNGDSLWMNVSTSVFDDPIEGDLKLICIFQDITKSKEAIKAVEDSESKFRSIFSETGHGIGIADKNGYFTSTNKKFLELTGASKTDLKKGLTPRGLVHPDHKEKIIEQFRNYKNDPTLKVQQEMRFVNLKTKKPFWIRLNLLSYRDSATGELNMVSIIEDISIRKNALYKLKVNEEYLSEIINALSIGLMVMNPSGEIEKINSMWSQIVERFARWRNATVKGNFYTLLLNENLPLVKDGLEAITNNTSTFFEMEVKLDDGAENWFALRAFKLKKEIEGIVISMQDITVTKKTERAMEESLNNYRNIYNLTPVMMHSIDPQGQLMSVSNFWLEKLGYQRHEVIGKNIRDFLTAESQKDTDVILPIFFKKGAIFDVSYHFKTKSGEIIEAILSAIEEGRGTRDSRLLGVVTDVTQLKKAERQLKSNRTELLEAQSIAKLGNFSVDYQTGLFTSSEVFDKILEIDDNVTKDIKLILNIIPRHQKKTVTDILSNLIENGGIFEHTGFVTTLKTNQRIWLECLGKTIEENGKFVGLAGTIQDISKSKNAELEIQKLSDRLSLAMKGANIGVWERDLSNNQLHFEDTMYQVFQLDKSQEMDTWRKFITFAHPDDRDSLRHVRKQVMEDQMFIDYDFRANLSDGMHHFRSMTRQVKRADGQLERLIGVVIDITEDKEILERLEKSLSEKDTLVKEVHHRVKNNMQMISSILALKSLDVTDDASRSVFDECTLRIKSMAVVHDQLYRFYDVSEIEISSYLHHLTSGLSALMGGGGTQYTIDVKADEFEMNVDTALLIGLVVGETVANAFKHGFKDLEEGVVTVKFENGSPNILSVTNTGHPFPSDILELKNNSLGISLIKTFTTQLGGKLSPHDNNGLKVEF